MSGRQALAQLDERVVADAATRSVAWPTGGGFVRRRVNAFARWLLRDYLETIDRRADTVNAGIDGLEEGHRPAPRDLAASLADAEREQHFVALLSASQAALEAAAGAHRQMLDLVNAKDAEVLQRAVGRSARAAWSSSSTSSAANRRPSWRSSSAAAASSTQIKARISQRAAAAPARFATR